MPKRTYDPPSSHITTPDSPSPHGPSVRLVLRAPDAGRRPLRGRSGRGRPVRMPGASRPGRRRSSSSGTTRRHAPGAPAQGPGTRPEAHHPHHGVRRTVPAAPDAGPLRDYAGSPPVADSATAPSGAPSAASVASDSLASDSSTAPSPVSPSTAAGPASPSTTAALPAPTTSSAPSAPSAHSVAETAEPPSAGCQTISPASFWIHSPSAHSSPA